MSQGLFTAVSGIRSCQSKIDVISDNIANMNTPGFKSSQLNFENVFVKTLSSGSAPSSGVGGSNPMQVGLGVAIGEISRNFNNGTVQTTGKSSDLNIQGDGFFTLANPNGGILLTRAGNFSTDQNGNLVNPKGLKVLGTDTVLGTSGSTTPILIPPNLFLATGMDTDGNLAKLEINANGTADVTGDWTGLTVTKGSYPLASFSIGDSGQITATYSNGDKITICSNPDDSSKVILQYRAANGQEMKGTADNTSGTDPKFKTNTQIAANQLQIQLANVTNPKGLLSQAGNIFSPGSNSGTMVFTTGNSGGLGVIKSGGLESSNVDLPGEFTEIVLAQRGVDANSRSFDAQNSIMRTIMSLGRGM